METHEDQQFLETMVRAIVDHPEEVHTQRSVDELGVLLTLDVHPDDMGKIIGRSGNTAKAIRTLLKVAGMKHDARVNLKINEPVGSDARERVQAYTHGEEVASPSQPQTIDEALDDLRV